MATSSRISRAAVRTLTSGRRSCTANQLRATNTTAHSSTSQTSTPRQQATQSRFLSTNSSLLQSTSSTTSSSSSSSSSHSPNILVDQTKHSNDPSSPRHDSQLQHKDSISTDISPASVSSHSQSPTHSGTHPAKTPDPQPTPSKSTGIESEGPAGSGAGAGGQEQKTKNVSGTASEEEQIPMRNTGGAGPYMKGGAKDQ